jgi:hypothetical protein
LIAKAGEEFLCNAQVHKLQQKVQVKPKESWAAALLQSTSRNQLPAMA